MDTISMNALSGSAAIDRLAQPPTSSLTREDLFNETDAQLMMLSAKGNPEAVLELENRDAALAARLAAITGQPPPPATADTQAIVDLEKRNSAEAASLSAAVALSVTADSQAILDVEKRDAVQATKLLAAEDRTVSFSGPVAVGNMVDTFA
jgi:hypothetical protein